MPLATCDCTWPIRYGSSPPLSALRPPRGSCVRSMHGPNCCCLPKAQNSSPMAWPTCSARPRFQVDTRPMPVGQAVAFWKRTPCGPSSITKPGILSRALSGVVMKPLLVNWASFSSVLMARRSESMRGSRPRRCAWVWPAARLSKNPSAKGRKKEEQSFINGVRKKWQVRDAIAKSAVANSAQGLATTLLLFSALQGRSMADVKPGGSELVQVSTDLCGALWRLAAQRMRRP